MPQDVDSPRGIVRDAGDENAFRLGARILDISPVPIAYLSAGLVVLQCNRAAAAHICRGTSDPLGRPLGDLIGRDSPIHTAAITAARMLRPVTAHLPPGPDGERAIASLSPDIDARGRLLGVVITISEPLAPAQPAEDADCPAAEPAAEPAAQRSAPQETARLRTELERNIALLRAVVDRSMEGVLIGDTDGRVRLYNAAVEDISGYTMDEVNDRNWFDLVHPDPEAREQSVARARRAAAGEPIEGETSIFRKDGSRRWIRYSLSPITGYDRPLVLALLADVTKRHQAEGEMRESEELFRAIFELSSAGIAQVDMHGRFKRVNRRFADLLGYPPERMEAMSFQDFTHPDDVEPDLRNMQRIMDGETDTFTMEKRYIRSDGEPVWTLLTAAAVRDEEGKPLYMVGVVQDISSRKREEDLALALHRIDSAIHSSLRFEEIMGGVVVEAVEALHSDYGRILLGENGRWTRRFGCRVPEAADSDSFTDEDAPGFDLAARGRKALAVDEAANDPRTRGEHVRSEGIRSTLIVPLVSRGEVLGMFELVYCSRSMRFSPMDASFAERVASSTALALENAQLYQAQQDVADTLQEAIIHMPAKVPGIAFCWLYGSATEASRVGGDFLDLFELSDNRVGVLIGDVSGKGIEAAALTAVVKNVVRAFAYEDPSPASVMRRLSRVVQLETGPEMFVTVFFGVLDAITGWMRYCSGGHPPAILCRTAGGVDLLDTLSPIVGALPAAEYEEGFERLEEGDTLLMYTDGAIEARNERGELFGKDRLVEAFQCAVRKGGLREVCQEVFGAVSAFARGKLADDIALLPLRLDPKGTAPPCCGENPPPRIARP